MSMAGTHTLDVNLFVVVVVLGIFFLFEKRSHYIARDVQKLTMSTSPALKLQRSTVSDYQLLGLKVHATTPSHIFGFKYHSPKKRYHKFLVKCLTLGTEQDIHKGRLKHLLLQLFKEWSCYVAKANLTV